MTLVLTVVQWQFLNAVIFIAQNTTNVLNASLYFQLNYNFYIILVGCVSTCKNLLSISTVQFFECVQQACLNMSQLSCVPLLQVNTLLWQSTSTCRGRWDSSWSKHTSHASWQLFCHRSPSGSTKSQYLPELYLVSKCCSRFRTFSYPNIIYREN